MGGWFVVLCTVGFLGFLGLKMIDIHWEKLKIQEAIKKLEPDFNNSADISESKILEAFEKKLVADFLAGERREELKKKIKFQREPGTLNVILEYEIKRSFLFGYAVSKKFIHKASIKFR